VDWLMKKIEEYLESLKFLKNDHQKNLKYLRLSTKLDFKEVRRAILQKMVGPFSWLQTYKEFTLLDRNDQIFIAIQRLYYLSNHLIEQIIRSYLFSRRCGGFFSIFSNY